MRRFLTTVTAGLAILLLAAGCGQGDTVEPGIQIEAGSPLTSAPIDAALVTPGFGWVLTADALLLTEDGGTTFRPAKVDLLPGLGRAAYFRDPGHGWVAAVDPAGVAVARTGDGGRSWTVTTIPTTARIAELSIAFGDAARGALVATVQTSGAFSLAELYTTTDGGASWQAGTAPVAGRVTVDPGGQIWLAGGVLGDELYASQDQGSTWARPRLTLTAAGTVEAVAAPVGGVVPVTVGDAGRSRVALLTSTDGGLSWREWGSVPLTTDTAVAVAAASAPDSSVLVADPAGARLSRATTATSRASAAVSEAPARGLPAGVSRVTFASPAAGWALASAGQCATGKQNCAITHSLVTTGDGGSTWHQVLRWVDKIG